MVQIYLSEEEFTKFLANAKCEGYLMPAIKDQLIGVLVLASRIKLIRKKALMGSLPMAIIE